MSTTHEWIMSDDISLYFPKSWQWAYVTFIIRKIKLKNRKCSPQLIRYLLNIYNFSSVKLEITCLTKLTADKTCRESKWKRQKKLYSFLWDIFCMRPRHRKYQDFSFLYFKYNWHSTRQSLLSSNLAPTGLFAPQYFVSVPLYQSCGSKAAAIQALTT